MTCSGLFAVISCFNKIFLFIHRRLGLGGGILRCNFVCSVPCCEILFSCCACCAILFSVAEFPSSSSCSLFSLGDTAFVSVSWNVSLSCDCCAFSFSYHLAVQMVSPLPPNLSLCQLVRDLQKSHVFSFFAFLFVHLFPSYQLVNFFYINSI